MEIPRMYATLPFLAFWLHSKCGVFMRCFGKAILPKSWGICALIGLLCAGPASATVIVYVSSAAPTGLQADFIQATTSQYLATVSTSIWFSNTFTVTLYGKNPYYKPPPPPQTIDVQALINTFISVSTYTYVYGFADGQAYERKHDIKALGNFNVLCSSPTAFHLFQASTNTWDLGTCEDALSTASNFVYQQNFSTPTVVPGF